MTEALPAIIQAMSPIQSDLEGQQGVEVKLKLSTGAVHWVHLYPGHPLLEQIAVGEHVLAVPVGHSQSGQQRFEIATNYGDVGSSTV